MNDTIFAETVAQMRTLLRDRTVWIGLVVAGGLVGLAGPFGTYDLLEVPARLGYWLVLVGTTYWIGFALSYAASSWAERLGLGLWKSVSVGAVVASVPVALWVAAWHGVIFGAEIWPEALRLWPYVIAITWVAAAGWEVLTVRADLIAEAAPPPTHPPHWAAQLPAHLGQDLILLQAQDHYVRVETTQGETLIRARLQDAAEALSEHGVRVHRSWWVARDAIEALTYRDGGPMLKLSDGRMVPVGRTYRRAVRAALSGSVG